MKPDTFTIDIAREFSETPFGRYRDDGIESGEVFRDDLLVPALKTHNHVTLLIDGVDGLPSSFWEEVMGGLIRCGFSLKELQDRLDIYSLDKEMQTFVRLGWRYAEEASNKKKQN